MKHVIQYNRAGMLTVEECPASIAAKCRSPWPQRSLSDKVRAQNKQPCRHKQSLLGKGNVLAL